MVRLLTLSISFLILLGCDETSPTDAGVVDAGADAGPVEADAGTDAGPPGVDVCAELGLTPTPFDASATGIGWEEVAADFTVPTLDGPWTLSEQWSGCESYVFIAYSSSDFGRALWGSLPDSLFTEGPRNVHYFFTTWEATDPAATARVTEMRTKIEEGFEFQGTSEEDRRFWRTHLHYVTTGIRQIEGSVGDLARGSAIILSGVGITREQRLDPVGSLQSIGRSGFRPDLGMARFVAPFYDYLFDLDARVAAETGVTVVDLARDLTTSDRRIDATVALPDAATMAGFDTLEVDVELTCLGQPDECSEWDRIAYVYLCADETCEPRTEMVRWITPYSRPGRRRWVMDATPFLGQLRAGGDHTFRMVFGPDWERATERVVSVSLRLSNRGLPDGPTAVELAHRGGSFDATYNDGRAPYSFTPPAGTTRVELVVLVSGHGQEAANNCAEWCDHHHTFSVGGADVATITFTGEAGTENGCADRSAQGVPPGQYGNWAPLRAGWCPGLPVPVRRYDITDFVDLTGVNELSYAGSFAGGAPAGGTIDLSAFVVYFQ